MTLRSDENKMTAQNLSTVFAPTLMPMPDLIDFKGAIPDMNRDISALHVIIENQSVIFNWNFTVIILYFGKTIYINLLFFTKFSIIL